MIRYDFNDQVVAITGGAGGIGAHVALAIMATGGHVAVWDLPAALANAPEGALAVAVDVTDPAAVMAAAEETAARLGPISGLVNSAGIAGPTAKLWDYPLDAWARVQRINLDGTFHACRAVVPGMIAQNYGRIVNIASIAGKEGNPNASAYSASKAAVIGLTKSLGKELCDTEITVNCIAPAAVESPIFEQMTPDHIAYMKSKIPMGRFGMPEEIAAMACWLASDEASFTTAAVFDQSGGRATY